MRRMPLRRLSFALALLGSAACQDEAPQGPTGSLAVRLSVPASLRAEVAEFRLTVYDQGASCAETSGDASGGAPLPDLSNVLLQPGPNTIKVTAGKRTFSVIAYGAASDRVARGCKTLDDIRAGGEYEVSITLNEYPPMPDAGLPDAMEVVPGDDCTMPLPLPFDTPTAGTTVGAADDFSASCGGGGRGDLVYEVMVPAPSRLTVTVEAPGAAVTASLRATCDVPGSEIRCAGPVGATTTLDVGFLPAGTYYVIVDAVDNTALGAYTITATLGEPSSAPANDTCAAPELLAGDGVPVPGTLVDASNDMTGSCGGAGGDVVYRIELTMPQRLELEVDAAGFDPVVYVRPACGNPAEIAGGCGNDEMGMVENHAIRELAPGTYFVIVDSTGGADAFTITATLLPPPPANDLCAGAELLMAGMPVMGQTLDANDDQALGCGVAGSAEVYYTFTLSSPGRVTLTLNDLSGQEHALAILNGCGPLATPVACASTPGTSETIDLPNLAAGTYIVAVEGVTGGGLFDLTYTVGPPIPEADECLTAKTITLGATTAGNLVDANDDAAGSCGGGGGDDEVYTFSIASTRRITVTSGAGFPHVLYLRSACHDAGTQVTCTAAPAGAGAIDIGALPAGTYFVWIDRTGVGDGTHNYDLLVQSMPPLLPPANDTCASPTPLGAGATTGTLVNGNDDTGATCGGAGGIDVYYTFTIAQPRRVRATVSGTGAPFDPVLSLRSECGAAATEVACANGSTGTTEVLEVMNLPAGTYTLVVDSATTGAGPFSLLWEVLDPPPANDSCASPTTLTPGVTLTGQTVAGAADDELGTGACASLAKTDVVYTFTTATDRRAVVTVNSTFNAAVYLRGADCTADGVDLACANASPSSEVIDVGFLPAGTYHVVVENMSGAGTTFDVTLNLLPPIVPGDSCAAPTVLPGTGGADTGTTAGKADDTAGTCGGAGGNDAVYSFQILGSRRVTITVDSGGTFEFAVYLRATSCETGAQQACVVSAGGVGVIDILNLPAGTYYIFVDALAGAGGPYDLSFVATAAVPPPANDTCASPGSLPSGPGQTLFGANDDYAGTCNPGGGVEGVYAFTVAQRSRVTFSANATGDVAVYLGSDCGVLASELGCSNATSTGVESLVLEDVMPGTYYAYVEGVSGYNGSFSPSLTITPPPGNDTCAGATTLTSGTTLTGQTLAVADDTTSGTCAAAGTTRDVFYTFTLAQRSVVNLTVANTGVNTTVSLRSACGDPASEVACSEATSPGESAQFVDLPAGTYVVVVDGPAGGASGTFDLTYTATVVPDNNSCVAPAPIATGATVGGTLASATNEYGGSCGGGSGGDVVFEFTLATPQRVRATLTRTSGTFDAVLYLRSACGSGGSEVAGGCSNASTGATEVLDIDTVPAGTYYLIVDSAGGTLGGFDLLVEELPIPPGNDLCSAPTPLPEGVTLSGSTVGARDNATGSCSAGGNEVFYTFTLATARRVVISLTNATSQHAIYVQGTCGSSGTQQACASTAELDETIEILNLAAGTYTIAVEAVTAGGGTFDLVYNTFAPVPHDTCSTPITLVDGVPRTGDSSVGALDQETGTCAGAGSTPDVVYTYTLGSNRRVNLQVTTTYDAAISIRSTCNNSVTESTCLDSVAGAGSEALDIRNQAPGTYFVIVDGVGGQSGSIDVSLSTSTPPPAGDFCPEVVALSEGATLDQPLSSAYANDTTGTCGGAGRERVYTFTIPGSRNVNISTSATFAHAAYLRGASCESGAESACNLSTFSGGTHTATISIPNLGAGTYFLFVDATAEGATGTFDITYSATAPIGPPPNDTCATPTILTEGLTTMGTLDAASDTKAVSCVAGSNKEVFYQFTIATNRHVTITSNSGFDTSLTLLANDCTTERQCVNVNAGGEQIIEENLPAGTYKVIVESVAGSSGTFTIGYTTSAPIIRPPNDKCAGAITLSSGVTVSGVNMNNALNDASGACGGASGNDVVYTFTIPGPSNQRAKITVSNASGFDPVVYAQGGTCGGAEVQCANARTDGTEVLDMPNLPPGTYYVWVDQLAGTATASFDIRLDLLTAVPPPSNDTCTSPSTMTAGVVQNGSTVGAADDYDLSCLAIDSCDTVHGFTLASAQQVLITITPQASPPWNLAAALRTAANCASTTDITCVVDAFFTRYINRKSLGAGSYRVVVDGNYGDSGDYTIRYVTRAPDTTFGYWAIESTDTYETIAGSTGATQITIPLTTPMDTTTGAGDEWSQLITLPFTFPYYGNHFTIVNAHSNGFLTLGTPANPNSPPTGSAAWVNDCPLDATTPNDTMALFWDDAQSRSEYPSQLWTKVEGTAPNRRFIIEYRDFDLLSCGMSTCTRLDARVNHQAILYENGDIEFRYGPRQTPSTTRGCTGGGGDRDQEIGGCATIGIEGMPAMAFDADQIQCDVTTPAVTNGRVITFVPPR